MGGGMGDEDEDQPENEQVWQKYFLSPMEAVDKVVCVTKENGEAAHLSVRMIQGYFFYFCGSKNVHLMFRTRDELEKYTEQRYMVAKTVANAWLNQAAAMEPEKLRLFCSFLHTTKMTAVFEVLCPDYQHVVSLSHLPRPELRFLTFTLQYGAASLTGLPPHVSLNIASSLGLATAVHEVILASQAESRMEKVGAVVTVVAEDEEKNAKSHLATCVVRRVDLLGKNMKKMQSAVQKSRVRRTNNPALPFIGVHDLAKVEK